MKRVQEHLGHMARKGKLSDHNPCVDSCELLDIMQEHTDLQ